MGKQEATRTTQSAWKRDAAKRSNSGGSAKHSHPTNQPASKKAAAAAPPPPRKYVVVVRNVENDFARVHASALERYCRLNRSLEKKLLRATSTPQAVDDSSAAPVEEHQEQTKYPKKRLPPTSTDISYEIKARTETRSAELCVYAPTAGADISAVWMPVANGDGEASTAENALPAGGRFSSLRDMTSVLKQKPYLAYPPVFMHGVGAANEDATETEGGCVRQSDFVTVELVTSSYTSNKNLKKVLSDVPGFVTCWPLYTMHFRGIFANEAALFRSKSLLDQFEAEGLRINLVLPDTTARRYEEYLTHQADE